MNAATVITIRPDDEYNADEFWASLDESFPAVAKSLRENDRALVTVSDWAMIQELPGFADGPAYARDALLEVED